MENARVLVRMDSTGAIRNIANSGGSHEHLTGILKDIWFILSRNLITVVPQWVPREVNGFADALSRCQNSTGFALSLESANWLFERFGLPNVDRFASFADHVMPAVWNSRFLEKGSADVDTFTQVSSWLESNLNFALPHPRDLPKLVEFLKIHRARSMVLVPRWRGALWFQNMCDFPHKRFFVDKKTLRFRDPQGKIFTSLWDFEIFMIHS